VSNPVDDRVKRAARLVDLGRHHPEVAHALAAIVKRYEVRGIGEFADRFPDDFDAIEAGLSDLIEQVPNAEPRWK
jgi:hypothetical protein